MTDRRHVVAVREEDAAWVVTLPGELGAEVEDSLVPAVERILASAPRLLVVDFSLVAVANSAGIGAIVDLVRRARERNVPIVLAALKGQPKLIVERIGLQRYAASYETVEAALEKGGER
jgi:anti-anti-sigma factor